MSPKEAYVISIDNLVKRCNDLSLLDLVYKILVKSSEDENNLNRSEKENGR